MRRFKWLLATSICVCIYALPACFQDTISSALAQTTKSETTAKETEELFALVTALEKSISFEDQVVTKLIGRPLINLSDSDKQNLYRYTNPDYAKLLWQVHLRKPIHFTKDDRGSLLLELNPNIRCITHEQIVKRYGAESSVAEQLAKGASVNRLVLNYDYERPWGILTFQVLKKNPHVLTSINLDKRTPVFPCGGIVDEQNHSCSLNSKTANEQPRTLAVDQIRGTYAGVFAYTDANPKGPSIVIAEKRSLGPGYKPKPIIFQEFSENPNPGGFLRHELGHSIDISLNYASHTPAFRAAYKDDISQIVDPQLKILLEHYLVPCGNGDTTFRREEVFAELFACKYGGGIESNATDETLHKSFPNLSNFIHDTVEHVISQQM